MHQTGDCGHVERDPGHVAGGREASEDKWMSAGFGGVGGARKVLHIEATGDGLVGDFDE